MLQHKLVKLLTLSFSLLITLVFADYDPSACNNSPSFCSRPYGSITYLGTHNSAFLRDASTGFSTSGNQYFNVTVQLDAGVRLLQGQIHDKSGVPTFCHGSCSIMDGGSLESYLKRVRGWLADHPSEVVTILLVNDDSIAPSKLRSAFSTSDMEALCYVPKAVQGVREFPTLKQMIDSKKRVVVFLSKAADQDEVPFILDEFTYIWETKWENTDPGNYSCAADRPGRFSGRVAVSEVEGIKSAENSKLVPLVNWFLYNKAQAFGILTPNDGYIKTTNGPTGVGSLGEGLATCIKSPMWSSLPPPRYPSYVLVDFFNEGPAIAQIDKLNNVTNPINRISPPSATSQKDSQQKGTDGDGDLTNGGGKVELEKLVTQAKQGKNVRFSEWILAAGDWGVGFSQMFSFGKKGSGGS